MKINKYRIKQKIRAKAYKRQLRRLNKKRTKQVHKIRNVITIPRKFRRPTNNTHNKLKRDDKKILSCRKRYIDKYLPINLRYLINTKESPFFIKQIKKGRFNSNGIIKIPKEFSIIEAPNDSYLVIKETISALLFEDNQRVIFDYGECEKIELGTQVILDIILKEFWIFRNKCKNVDRCNTDYFPREVGGININNDGVHKLIFSVGSPVTLKIKEHRFPDIIPYKLCIHDKIKIKDPEKRMDQKEIDTTKMIEYVVDCLKRMNKRLTPEKLDDLCTVIGEILINAEEHSSTKCRFSIGYFKEENIDNKHYGIFRLVILNFGQTIYQKFTDKDCQNKDIVTKMQALSSTYTKKSFYKKNTFEEESLWTLYALQEGVSSVSPNKYKRGNGSIRFIESFFNIKGSKEVDDISYLKIQSGKTEIYFNGEFGIEDKKNSSGDSFKVMTFNKSGNIEDLPDNKFVSQTKHFFPGTIISAELLLNDDDIVQIED